MEYIIEFVFENMSDHVLNVWGMALMAAGLVGFGLNYLLSIFQFKSGIKLRNLRKLHGTPDADSIRDSDLNVLGHILDYLAWACVALFLIGIAMMLIPF